MLKAGKIDENILQRTILKGLGRKKEFEDAGEFLSGNSKFLASSAADEVMNPFMAEVIINRAVNSLCAAGGEPKAITLQIMAAEETEESFLADIIKNAKKTVDSLGLEIVNGHTGVGENIKAPVVSVTAIGKKVYSFPDKAEIKKNAPAFDIVMTGCAGLSGAAYLARTKQDELLKYFNRDFLEEIQNLACNQRGAAGSSTPQRGAAGSNMAQRGAAGSSLSVRRAAEIAMKHGAVRMHDISHGGVYGALWEICEMAGTGAYVDSDIFPVSQHVIELCEQLDINVFQLLGDGSLLVVCESGEALVKKYRRTGISADVIGHLTQGNARVIKLPEGEKFMEPNRRVLMNTII